MSLFLFFFKCVLVFFRISCKAIVKQYFDERTQLFILISQCTEFLRKNMYWNIWLLNLFSIINNHTHRWEPVVTRKKMRFRCNFHFLSPFPGNALTMYQNSNTFGKRAFCSTWGSGMDWYIEGKRVCCEIIVAFKRFVNESLLTKNYNVS